MRKDCQFGAFDVNFVFYLTTLGTYARFSTKAWAARYLSIRWTVSAKGTAKHCCCLDIPFVCKMVNSIQRRKVFLQRNHLSIKLNPKNVLTMIRVKFSEMEFVVRKFHRPMNRLWLIWMLQSNEPTSSTALCLNYHIFRLLIGCADTFLQIKWDFHSLHVQIGKCKSRWIKSYFCIPIKLSESMEYFSASFLLIPNTLATS